MGGGGATKTQHEGDDASGLADPRRNAPPFGSLALDVLEPGGAREEQQAGGRHAKPDEPRVTRTRQVDGRPGGLSGEEHRRSPAKASCHGAVQRG